MILTEKIIEEKETEIIVIEIIKTIIVQGREVMIVTVTVPEEIINIKVDIEMITTIKEIITMKMKDTIVDIIIPMIGMTLVITEEERKKTNFGMEENIIKKID